MPGELPRGKWCEHDHLVLPDLLPRPSEHLANLFPQFFPGFNFWFQPTLGPRRQQLADRIFLGDRPERVFLGYGVDWDHWHDLKQATMPGGMLDSMDRLLRVPDAQTRILRFNADLIGQWGFLDDKLVAGPMVEFVDKSYYARRESQKEREDHAVLIRALVQEFRSVFTEDSPGWIDVIPYTDNLVLLRAQDGALDFVWRDLREGPPPGSAELTSRWGLHPVDLPMALLSEGDLDQKLYFRRPVWHEREAHLAEQDFYDRGGEVAVRQRSSASQVLASFLVANGTLPKKEVTTLEGTSPSGFSKLRAGGRALLVSKLVTAESLREWLVETGYAERRTSEAIGNVESEDREPAAVTWLDAQAFLAWKERQVGVRLRLPTLEELRQLRPFYSAHYASMARLDFPWENFPPRPLVPDVEQDARPEEQVWMEPYLPAPKEPRAAQDEADGQTRVDVPGAVTWSEPRFFEPSPEVPEFQEASGFSTSSRRRWIDDWPPKARWSTPQPWTEHSGLRFLDAWDAYEWCQEPGSVSGRFWEGEFGVSASGAAKHSLVGFRMVIALD